MVKFNVYGITNILESKVHMKCVSLVSNSQVLACEVVILNCFNMNITFASRRFYKLWSLKLHNPKTSFKLFYFYIQYKFEIDQKLKMFEIVQKHKIN